jgi:hypothetical protein
MVSSSFAKHDCDMIMIKGVVIAIVFYWNVEANFKFYMKVYNCWSVMTIFRELSGGVGLDVEG